MKPWSQRVRNLVLFSVLLAGAVCITGIVTTPRGEKRISATSQQQVISMQKDIKPPDTASRRAAETERTQMEDRERPVDVF